MSLERYLTHSNESVREVIKNCLNGTEEVRILKNEYIIDEDSTINILNENLYIEGSLIIGSATNLEEIKSKLLIIDGNFHIFDCHNLKNLDIENLVVRGGIIIEDLSARYRIANGSVNDMSIYDCRLQIEDVPIVGEKFTANFLSISCCFLEGPFCDDIEEQNEDF